MASSWMFFPNGFDLPVSREFIRLEYDGGDWDQDLSSNADLNLLIEYGIRTGQAVSDRTEFRRIAQWLDNTAK